MDLKQESFNQTRVELKLISGHPGFPVLKSFNQTRVELKLPWNALFIGLLTAFNQTRVELKRRLDKAVDSHPGF